MTLPGFKFYQAHSSNYTKGRPSSPKKFTVHHTAANNSTLRYLWQDPDRNGSSTLFVSDTKKEQYLSLDDTPWTNGNFSSNQESITCETNGRWFNGYKNLATLDNLEEAMYQCLLIYPKLGLNYHKDVSVKYTACPEDLKEKGYAQVMWDKAKKRINGKPVANLRVDIPDKKVVLIRDANVWDMSFTSWRDAKAVTRLKAGTVVDVAGLYDHELGGDYYLSNYSWDKGLNNGININDCKDYVPPKPKPIPPTTPPVDNPTTEESNESPQGGAGDLKPVPEDPTTGERLTRLEALVNKIVVFLETIFKDFRR